MRRLTRRVRGPQQRRSPCAARSTREVPAVGVVALVAGAAVGLWLPLTAVHDGLPAATSHLLLGLAALALLAVLATMVHRTRQVARQITHISDPSPDVDLRVGADHGKDTHR